MSTYANEFHAGYNAFVEGVSSAGINRPAWLEGYEAARDKQAGEVAEAELDCYDDYDRSNPHIEDREFYNYNSGKEF